jgi:hypothetical protein
MDNKKSKEGEKSGEKVICLGCQLFGVSNKTYRSTRPLPQSQRSNPPAKRRLPRSPTLHLLQATQGRLKATQREEIGYVVILRQQCRVIQANTEFVHSVLSVPSEELRSDLSRQSAL